MRLHRSPQATRLLTAMLLMIFLLAPDRAPAQTETASGQPESERPKIGLVLGGGGARGGAHIGVLQVLMEMHVPVDYVVGTSMGAVIGALYAVGKTPDEIDAIVTAVDWDDLFTDHPERTQRSFRRKQDDTAEFLPIEWGWKKGIVLSSGAIAGQKLSFAFRAPALYLLGHDGFDNLSIPFRAVATDLQTGLMFVPDRGNLLKAVRASMSIPGVFPPVEWNGHQLVDGYLARNLPVDVARELGADIIIAVDVGALPQATDPEKFNTIGGISEQKGYIGARQNVDPMLPLADIVIQPDLAGISTRDFKRIDATITPGRQAALAVAPQLQELALSTSDYITHLQRHKPVEIPNVIIERVELDNQSRADDRAILAHIRQPLGQELDLDLLKADLATIYDFGVFELVDFSIRTADGQYVLTIHATPKYYAPNVLNFGISYAGGDGGRSDFVFRARWTRNELNAFGGELRTDMLLGRLTGIQTELYQPLAMNRVPFMALTGRASYDLKPWYFDLRNWGEYRVRKIEALSEMGLRIGHYGEIRGGLLYGSVRAANRTGLSLAEFDGPRGGYTATVSFDMLDYPILPRKGWHAALKYFNAEPGLGSDLNYERLSGAFGIAHTMGRNTFHFSLKGGTDFHTAAPQFDLFTLGGLSRMSGYAEDQLRGEVFGLGKLAWYRRISGATSPYATSWFIAAQFEAGNAWYWYEDPGIDSLRYSGVISLVGTTFAGPLSISYGRAKDGHDALYLNLGVTGAFTE